MYKILLALPLLVVLSSQVIADTGELKRYASLAELKQALQALALSKGIASGTCAAHRPPKIVNKSGNIIISTKLNIIGTNYQDIVNDYFKANRKIEKTQDNMNTKACYDISEGSTATASFVRNKEATHSTTVTSESSATANVSFSVPYTSIGVQTSYTSTSGTSTQIGGKTSVTSQSTEEFSWTEGTGDYRVVAFVNRYSLAQKADPNQDVEYTIGSIHTLADCHYVYKGTANFHPHHGAITSMAQLGHPTKVVIATPIDYNVSYVDEWPSYVKQAGKTCQDPINLNEIK